ncbi:MAG: hypothetical protein HY730_06010 [Candidatus Tectomicrobia bacterium]|uniref:Uncharacterized protein n=1 Tax=Tectimicrobiota bacterium TaxID=2528274 RepID=A0A933LQP1_UNCTE|nr:hypothetical protein [Candidatus Tectomicrobia bacterium]
MRTAVFYVFLSSPIIAWMSIIIPYALGHSDVAGSAVKVIVDLSPFVTADLSVFGELAPPALAALLVATVPTLGNRGKVLVFAIALTTYILYLYLSIFFTSSGGGGVLSGIWGDTTQAKEIILKLLSNMRMLAVLSAAGILGIKIKRVTGG